MHDTPIEHELVNPHGNKKRILVTGSPRSGTTWTGRMIACAPGMGYVHEPFTPEEGILCGFANPLTAFQYITDENSYNAERYLESLLDFKYPLRTNLLHSKSAREAAQMLWVFKDLSMHRLRRNTAVMKDPLAVFSAPWLARHFNMNVVVTIRHPAAVCSSLKLLNWKFDFNYLLSQPALMRETRLADFESEIRYFAKNEQEIILQGALLWNCIYAMVDEYRMRYPAWLFLKHEELSMDPLDSFRKIYVELGLNFTADVRAAIEESTSGQNVERRITGITLNPFEQVRDDQFSLKRKSKETIFSWKDRLSDREISTIREQTNDVSKMFYSDLDW